jgi:hypothetical protein
VQQGIKVIIYFRRKNKGAENINKYRRFYIGILHYRSAQSANCEYRARGWPHQVVSAVPTIPEESASKSTCSRHCPELKKCRAILCIQGKVPVKNILR